MDDDDNDCNDDNNGNGGEDHDGSNGDSSDGGGQYRRVDLPVIPEDLHPKAVFDWNGIDEKIANDIVEYLAVGPIGNMHVNKEAPICFEELAYDQVDEELNDDDYDEVTNKHGTEDGNAHGRNSDDNDRNEGGGTGAAIGSNNDVAFVGSMDGGSSNVSYEHKLKKLQTREYKLKTFYLRQI